MPKPSRAVAVRHPVVGNMVALDPGVDYADDDPLVAAYPWAFAEIVDGHRIIESVVVESATARPGEKRRIGRK